MLALLAWGAGGVFVALLLIGAVAVYAMTKDDG